MINIAFMMTVVVMMAHAQGALKRVYNETIDPMTQIDEGLQKAKVEGKFVNSHCRKKTVFPSVPFCTATIFSM